MNNQEDPQQLLQAAIRLCEEGIKEVNRDRDVPPNRSWASVALDPVLLSHQQAQNARRTTYRRILEELRPNHKPPFRTNSQWVPL